MTTQIDTAAHEIILSGEYEPSPSEFVRDQVETYERTGGAEGNTNPAGKPVIILTTKGAKSGKIRKTPLMRIERDGRYLDRKSVV